MKKPFLPLSLILLCTLLFVGNTAHAQKKSKTKKKAKQAMQIQTQTKLPDLIDREIFFGDPEISRGRISPDGKYFSFVKPYKDIRNIWVKGIDEPFENAKPITADENRPIPNYFWSRDSKYILFVQDKGGDENFHVYAVDVAGFSSSKDKNKIPESKALTSGENVRAAIYRVPKTNPDIMYVGLNDRDPAYHDLYEVQISTGNKKLLVENTEKISGWVYDNEDKIRLASRATDDGGSEILRVDNGKFTQIYKTTSEETAYNLRFTPDNKKAYLVSNKGDLDLMNLMLMDPMTGATEIVESDPKNEVDFGGAFFSGQTNELIATFYNSDKVRGYFKDKTFEADYNFLQSKFPGSEVDFGSSTSDENLWTVSINTDTDPGAIYLFNRKERTVDFVYRGRPDLPIESLAKMTPVSYKSSDGMKIPAYLTLPKGVEAKNLPAIMYVHGGPWARDSWGFDAFSQFWANRGYAVLQPNFRSSTGYGKAFLNAGNGEWGQLMQDDITWGTKYLIEQGIADPDKIAVFGGSYGGYVALAGVTFTPDTYAASISIVGPSNLLTLLESIPPYWEAFRKTMYLRMADPNTEEGMALLKKQSPLFSANKIKTPLMVVQGANDPRVKQAESDQIVVAMRDLGLPVEYLVAEDEGHGFRKPINNMAFVASAEKFFATHLGGRYQKEMPADVAAKLKELTMDISKVTLPKALDMGSIDDSKNKPMMKVNSMGVYEYKAHFDIGGNKMPMDGVRTITEDGNTIIVKDLAKTAMGDISDECVFNKETYQPISRKTSQGPATMAIQHNDGKISGVMAMNGKEMPIDVNLKEDIFGDGGTLELTIASLPLEKGFKTVYKVFNIQTQKIDVKSLEVTGTEMVKTAAGDFDTFVVDIKAADGSPGNTTYWIAQKERITIKNKSVIPEMNGAIYMSELSKMETISAGK